MSENDNNTEVGSPKSHGEYISKLEEIAQQVYDPNVDVFSKAG